jgi:ABC-type nitrate/sulfonate/bicarbonate transport system substrate-binding protein
MDRPLRVVGLGFDVLAPGIVANRGTAPGPNGMFAEQGLEVELSIVAQPVDVERALASGGADQGGADVAVLPLPTFVAASERLRALQPRIFMVLGWSHDREALLGRGVTLLALPPSDLVLAAEQGSPAAFLATFVLDLAGHAPSRVRIVAPGSEEAAAAQLVAIDRGTETAAEVGEATVLCTTADATRLTPYVAVAPEGFVASHGDALAALAQGWLRGAEELRRDVPDAARRISALAGAPDALAMIERLGQIQPADLRDNARATALSGRGAVTIESLFRLAWRLAREAGVLTSPCPERAPVASSVVEALVRAGPPADSPRPDQAVVPPAPLATAGDRARVLLAWTAPAGPLDADGLVGTIGLVAGVFGPLQLRVGVRGARPGAAEVLGTARERFDLDPRRLLVARRVAGGVPASIEVLAAP